MAARNTADRTAVSVSNRVVLRSSWRQQHDRSPRATGNWTSQRRHGPNQPAGQHCLVEHRCCIVRAFNAKMAGPSGARTNSISTNVISPDSNAHDDSTFLRLPSAVGFPEPAGTLPTRHCRVPCRHLRSMPRDCGMVRQLVLSLGLLISAAALIALAVSAQPNTFPSDPFQAIGVRP